MAKMKIKKNDLVQVVTGRKQENGGDRGKTGRVIEVYPERNRVLVEGINRVTKHTKAGVGGGAGGIQTVEARDTRFANAIRFDGRGAARGVEVTLDRFLDEDRDDREHDPRDQDHDHRLHQREAGRPARGRAHHRSLGA